MKKLLIIAAALISLTLVITLLVYRIPLTEKYIRYQIDNANYCTDRFDCAPITDGCPFGCNIYVNQGKVTKIQGVLNNAPRTCQYRCPISDNVICRENRCEATY